VNRSQKFEHRPSSNKNGMKQHGDESEGPNDQYRAGQDEKPNEDEEDI